jgi:hypothetical protein
MYRHVELKTREGDKDAYENTLNALHSIPLIVSSKPADAKSMCGLVFRELLRLTNSFNIEVLLLHHPLYKLCIIAD